MMKKSEVEALMNDDEAWDKTLTFVTKGGAWLTEAYTIKESAHLQFLSIADPRALSEYGSLLGVVTPHAKWVRTWTDRFAVLDRLDRDLIGVGYHWYVEVANPLMVEGLKHLARQGDQQALAQLVELALDGEVDRSVVAEVTAAPKPPAQDDRPLGGGTYL